MPETDRERGMAAVSEENQRKAHSPPRECGCGQLFHRVGGKSIRVAASGEAEGERGWGWPADGAI
jgi:hypothetical protein